MIIENGYITVYVKTGGGIDSKNNPIKPSFNEVNIPCQYQQKKRVNSGTYEGGHYTDSSYEIFVDISSLEIIKKGAKLKLTSNTIGVLGDYEMTKPDVLELIGQVKISI